ncbi:S8 family serine peptidase [Ideonella sp.]|jgi:subtilisin family serine protease|uniref:S8 family serine peptidase n=1 Tax=Ideonella sp. TaxID=1929293 RepID=UPI0037BFA7AF
MTIKSTLRFTRISAALGLALATMGMAQAADTTRVIVEFKSEAQAEAAARKALAMLGGKVKLEMLGGGSVAAEVPTKALASLRGHAAIADVSIDAPRYALSTSTPSAPPYMAGQKTPYGIKLVQADLVPNLDANAANRKLCIIDSGYDNSHEDLAGNDVTGEFDSGTGWWYTDENSHGTHVAGTIAAINNSGVGVVGVNPNKKLKLHIVKVFGADGWAYSSTLSNAAKKCQAAGANIISMSLGGSLNNPLESKVFADLQAAGILSIAAAGNGGNTKTSYPAGYKSVVSVGGVDMNKALYTASQRNKDVEIAGPAVAVLSTVPMGKGTNSALNVGATAYAPGGMAGSPNGTVTAPLANFGLGKVVDTAMAGKVCLIQRGEIAFSEKVLNCQNSGGVGAIVYNNIAGGFGGTLGGTATTIPSVTATDVEGAAMVAQVGQSATLTVTASNYAEFDGTSMATPHVAAVAAMVWSHYPTCTGEQIRASLNKSALDLGTAGRDTSFGWGLVQAKAAFDRIKQKGCGK